MLIYFIAGFSTCKDFAAIAHLCQYLKWRYPGQFHYKKLVTYKACYKSFARSLCRKFGWREFTGSPMIWKQFGWTATSGTTEFLGDENRFQELMNEIYGVETFIPCEEKFNLAKDEHNFFLEAEKLRNKPRHMERRIVCVMNSGHPACRTLVIEILLSGRAFQKKDGVEIRLLEENEGLKTGVEQCIQDGTYLNSDTDTGENIIHSVTSLEEGLLNCELLIILPEAEENVDESAALLPEQKYQTLLPEWKSQPPLQEQKDQSVLPEQNSGPVWPEQPSQPSFPHRESHLEKLLNDWKHLADRLNTIEPTCKVLLFPTQHCCLKLTCMVEFLHKIRAFDVVGVTEDLALNKLSQASERSGIPKQDFLSVPPVWGFIGVKHLVDICSMKWSYNRTMPDGKVLNETRQMMLYHDRLQPIWEERSPTSGLTQNQVAATVELMNEWFAEKPSGRAFSAAVLSDGTFNLPSGLYFSQPVTCVKHEWIPYSSHPSPQESIPLDQLYSDILPILETLQLGRKWNAIWLSDEMKNSYPFLLEDALESTSKEAFSDHPLKNRERLELKKYLGMRNQLYPNSFKFNINHIRDFEGGSSLGRNATGEEDEEQGLHINWDRIEPTEVKTDSLDFLVDEYLAQLMADYGVAEEIEEEEEEEELELEDLGNISSDN